MPILLLIRHGETLWNEQGRMQGQHDSPLTPTGLHQARQLGRRLQSVTFSTLYSSDLGRAYQTARCIADTTGKDIVSDPGLRERGFGIFEGLTNAEIRSRYPEEYGVFARRDPHYRMKGGESAAEFQSRVVETLGRIAQRHGDETIVVVSHGLVLDAIYRAACGMALDAPRGFPLLNCSINTFEYRAGRWKAVAVCDVQHLSAAEVTTFSDSTIERRAAATDQSGPSRQPEEQPR